MKTWFFVANKLTSETGSFEGYGVFLKFAGRISDIQWFQTFNIPDCVKNGLKCIKPQCAKSEIQREASNKQSMLNQKLAQLCNPTAKGFQQGSRTVPVFRGVHFRVTSPWGYPNSMAKKMDSRPPSNPRSNPPQQCQPGQRQRESFKIRFSLCILLDIKVATWPQSPSV